MTYKGQFGVVRTNTFYGQVIRLGTRSQVNHAFVVIDDDGTIVEATKGEVRLGHVLSYPNAIYSRFPLRAAEQDTIVRNASALIGTPYNWIDIGVLALMSLGLRQKWMTQRAMDTHELFCSQAVDVIYRRSGIHLFNDKRPSGFVVPGDLLLLIAQRSACTSIPEGKS